MKRPVVAFVVVAFLFIGIVDADHEDDDDDTDGSGDQCTTADLVAFTSGLPNGLACLSALLAINTTLQGGGGSLEISTLETACDDSTCGGEIYRWYIDNCNQPDDAQNIEDLCYQQPDGTYCITFLSSFRGASSMTTLAQSLAACSPATPMNPCPDGCGQALQEIINNLGCCWTSYVNSGALTDPTILGTDLAMQFEAAIAAAEACNLDAPEECEDPFSAAAGAVVVTNAVVGVALMLAAFLVM